MDFETYDPNDDQTGWFSKIRELATNLGYAAKPKDYRKNPEQYKGHVGDVSTVIRVALMGRRTFLICGKSADHGRRKGKRPFQKSY